MSFSYPLGFLVLLFIPILIIIYILKNKFTEQTVSSTYLWTLSERFLKVRRPISRIYGILSLLLQILAVIVIAFAIAHPKISLPNSARDLCFILDGSGSMNITDGEKTRFEKGKDEIQYLINDSVEGSTYTLICVSDAPRVVFREMSNKERAIELLNSTTSSSVSSNCIDALPYAQDYFDENRSMLTYLVSDKNYETNNLNLISVGSLVDNYAIGDVSYSVLIRRLRVNGNVKSYQGNKDVRVVLYIDDVQKAEQTIYVSADTQGTFSFEDIEIEEGYKSIKVAIVEEDALISDNEKILYNIAMEHQNTALLISDNPFYLKSILTSFNRINLTVIPTADYSPEIHRNFGLYIFHSYNPNGLPEDGAVWLINIEGATPDYGFSYQETHNYGSTGVPLTLSTRSGSILDGLREGLTGDSFYVTTYQKYGLYKNNYSTLLSYEGDPLLFVGNTSSGNRQAVIAFDIGNSNLALSFDYIAIMNNLVTYSFPTVLNQASYVAGDKIIINVVANCSSIQVVAPSGNSSYLDVSSSIAEYTTTEAGTYTINVLVAGEMKTFNVYASIPEAESNVASVAEVTQLALQGELEQNFGDGIYQSIIYLFIILGVIFVADWLVYCYEQYKLR